MFSLRTELIGYSETRLGELNFSKINLGFFLINKLTIFYGRT